MSYNPKIHNRRSIRLKGYDYSKEGLYFITLCCQNRVSYFGKIEDGAQRLNEAGKMIEKWYWELENKFPRIRCREMVVMPNHFHCIIENVPVGADLRVCPSQKTENGLTEGEGEGGGGGGGGGEHTGSPQPDSPQPGSPQRDSSKPTSISTVVQWFKTMTTNEYMRGVKTLGWKRFDGKLWQRNYWEHIIRNEDALNRIANYIIENPIRWELDKLKATKNRA